MTNQNRYRDNNPYRYDHTPSDKEVTTDKIIEAATWIVIGILVAAIYYYTFG